MDYEDVSAAIALRFTGLTPPTGERSLVGTDDLPNQIGSTPVALVFPPTEDYEWGPGRTATSILTFTVRFVRAQEGDYPRRMAALAKWRKVLKTALIGNIQLGLGYVDWCYLRSSAVEEFTYAETTYDAVTLTVEVRVREQVAAAV